MEIKPLAQMLEDLLYEATDDGLEVVLAEAEGTELDDWGAVQTEYEHRYQRATAAVCEHRGAPSFRGTAREPNFPAWLRADRVACWSDAAGVVYLALREASPTIVIVGGGRPHPVKREAPTLLPPSD